MDRRCVAARGNRLRRRNCGPRVKYSPHGKIIPPTVKMTTPTARKQSQVPEKYTGFGDDLFNNDVIISGHHNSSLLYPDAFHPDPISYAHRHPSKRLLFESQMTELVATTVLQVDDQRKGFFTSGGKDAFCSILSKATAEGANVGVFSAHKVMDSNNTNRKEGEEGPVVMQNGFTVKVKNVVNGKVVLVMKRRTLVRPDGVDGLDVFMGNKMIPIGRIRKPSLLQYSVYGDGVSGGGGDSHRDEALFVIQKASAGGGNYVVYVKNGSQQQQQLSVVGKIHCGSVKKGSGNKKGGGTSDYHLEVNVDLTITEKALLLGAVFLIASRLHSGMERAEEKTRESLAVVTAAADPSSSKKLLDKNKVTPTKSSTASKKGSKAVVKKSVTAAASKKSAVVAAAASGSKGVVKMVISNRA